MLLKKHPGFCFIIVIAAFTACSPFREGIRLQKGNKYKEAITYFSDRIPENRFLYLIYDLRGMAYMNLGEFENAERDFDSAIVKLSPYNIFAGLNGAISCMHTGKPEKAQRLVKDVMKQENANAVAAMLRGMLYIYNEKYEDALLDINFAQKYTSYQGYKFCNRLCYRYYKAFLYDKLGKPDDAINEIQSLIKHNKKFELELYYLTGNFYLKNGNEVEAKKYYKLCADSASPYNISNLKAKARLHYPANAFVEKGELVDSIILKDTLYRFMAERLYNLSAFYAVKQDYDKSISYLAQAFQKNAFGLTAIRLDIDLSELGRLYNLNKLYLSHGKEIVSLK